MKRKRKGYVVVTGVSRTCRPAGEIWRTIGVPKESMVRAADIGIVIEEPTLVLLSRSGHWYRMTMAEPCKVRGIQVGVAK